MKEKHPEYSVEKTKQTQNPDKELHFQKQKIIYKKTFNYNKQQNKTES